MLRKILISDSTLRDGNHACGHQLSIEQIAIYAEAADKAGVPIVEVGHGNGLGASSLQVGLCKESDEDMLEMARKHLLKSKLGIHVIPGFATINRDLIKAIDIGVDVIRIASHCTEADITQRHLGYVRERVDITHHSLPLISEHSLPVFQSKVYHQVVGLANLFQSKVYQSGVI